MSHAASPCKLTKCQVIIEHQALDFSLSKQQQKKENDHLNLCSTYLKTSEFWPCGCWLRETLPCSLEQTEDHLCLKISCGTKSREIQQELRILGTYKVKLLSVSIFPLHCLWGINCIFVTGLVLFTFQETSSHSFLSGENHVSLHGLTLNVMLRKSSGSHFL